MDNDGCTDGSGDHVVGSDNRNDELGDPADQDACDAPRHDVLHKVAQREMWPLIPVSYGLSESLKNIKSPWGGEGGSGWGLRVGGGVSLSYYASESWFCTEIS